MCVHRPRPQVSALPDAAGDGCVRVCDVLVGVPVICIDSVIFGASVMCVDDVHLDASSVLSMTSLLS